MSGGGVSAWSGFPYNPAGGWLGSMVQGLGEAALLMFSPRFWPCLEPTIRKLAKLLLRSASSPCLCILKFKASRVQPQKDELSALLLMWQMVIAINTWGSTNFCSCSVAATQVYVELTFNLVHI